MTTTVESARRDWEDGHRRFVAVADERGQGEALHLQLDVLVDELRRRVGQTFTLEALAAAYATSDHWVREAIGERAAMPGWPATLTLVIDEAFHRYSRGATDFEP